MVCFTICSLLVKQHANNSLVAPPGWYQIFVLDGPKPSHSIWARIGGSIADAAGIGKWPAYPDFSTPGLGAVGT